MPMRTKACPQDFRACTTSSMSGETHLFTLAAEVGMVEIEVWTVALIPKGGNPPGPSRKLARQLLRQQIESHREGNHDFRRLHLSRQAHPPLEGHTDCYPSPEKAHAREKP